MAYGEMLLNLKKYGKAREIFKACLKNNPDDKEVQGLLQKAEDILEKVKKLNQVVEKIL